MARLTMETKGDTYWLKYFKIVDEREANDKKRWAKKEAKIAAFNKMSSSLKKTFNEKLSKEEDKQDEKNLKWMKDFKLRREKEAEKE